MTTSVSASAKTLALCMALATCAPRAFTAPVLLGEIDRMAATEDAASVEKFIEENLAKATFPHDDEVRIRIRLAQVKAAARKDGEDEANAYLIGVVGEDPALSAETYLAAAEAFAEINKPKSIFSDGRLAGRTRFFAKLLSHPALKAPSPARGALLMKLGAVREARGMGDVARDAYLEAAACFPDDCARRVKAIRAAARAVWQYRDSVEARDILLKVLDDKEVAVADAHAVLLDLALGELTPDQFDWVPQEERLALAKEYLGKVTAGRKLLVPVADLLKVKCALMHAESLAGHHDAAIALGHEIMDDPNCKGNFRNTTALTFAEALVAAGQYREAVVNYELANEGNLDHKNLLKRLGAAARKCGDYEKAMTAYNNALQYCDYEEGKFELNQLRTLVGLMSRALHNRLSTTSSTDRAFDEPDKGIEELSLDEF